PSQAGWSISEQEDALGFSDELVLTTPQGAFKMCGAPGQYGQTEWHYYVLTWSGTSLHCYADALEVSHTTASLQPIDGTVNALTRQFTVNDPGTIDELALYPTALSSSTVGAHYNDAVVPYILASPSLTDATVAGRDRTGDTESTDNGAWSGAFGD